jgi:hypothetical protein
MAALTVKFAVQVELNVPDEVAARMSKRDLCDSLELAVRTQGASPVVLDGELLTNRFAWALAPKSDELPETELELDVFADHQFPKLES